MKTISEEKRLNNIRDALLEAGYIIFDTKGGFEYWINDNGRVIRISLELEKVWPDKNFYKTKRG